MSAVSSVPEMCQGGGNSISPPVMLVSTINPAKCWAFTLNNWSDDEYHQMCAICANVCAFTLIAKEVGTSGTPHLQGYLEFKTRARPMSVFKDNKRIHWEKAKGSRQDNIAYCSKENLVFNIGLPKPIKIITDLRPFQLDIEKLILTEPDDRTIHWYYDSVGNIGKSAFIKYCVVKHSVCYIAGGKYSDIMNIIFNTDMDKINCVMLDIPRANEGNVSYASLESIKNGLISNTKYETGTKVFNSPHVVVFANFAPKHMYKLSADRWRVTNLGSNDDQDLSQCSFNSFDDD